MSLHVYMFLGHVIRNLKRGVVPVRLHHKSCSVTRSLPLSCKELVLRQAITLDILPLVSICSVIVPLYIWSLDIEGAWRYPPHDMAA